jgi:hypothetical protein
MNNKRKMKKKKKITTSASILILEAAFSVMIKGRSQKPQKKKNPDNH